MRPTAFKEATITLTLKHTHSMGSLRVYSSTYKVCKKCNNEILKEEKVCHYCGHENSNYVSTLLLIAAVGAVVCIWIFS